MALSANSRNAFPNSKTREMWKGDKMILVTSAALDREAELRRHFKD